jgi:zinc D-Ala-D-Ala carboxypeptidase
MSKKPIKIATFFLLSLLASLSYGQQKKAKKITLAMENTDYLMGKFDPAMHKDFVLIPQTYADKANMYLHKEVWKAYLKMYDAARKDGIDLTIISATRNFDLQKSIWERKWKAYQSDKNVGVTGDKDIAVANKILEYSSMPSTSRHHWGTDIDINSLDNDYFAEGYGKKVYDWMQDKGKKFGFILVYTAGRPTGYKEERWHYTYLPVSKKLTHMAKEKLKDELIQGFLGSHLAPKVGMVKNYVLGINEDCF